jgi:hypothetical protein
MLENDQHALTAARRLTKGQVIPLTSLLAGRIEDEAVPRALLTVPRCTFITINVVDFWLRVPPHPLYAIICVRLNQDETRKLRGLLAPLLRHPDFKYSRARCGKVFLITPTEASYYTRIHGSIYPCDLRRRRR